MNPKYRLLALDLDGTTLTPHQTISSENKHWIDQAINAGVTVIFATGRGVHSIQDFKHILPANAPLVLANGSEIWHKYGELMERNFLEQEDVARLYELATANGASFWAYSTDKLLHPDTWTDAALNERWLKFGIHHSDLDKMAQVRATAKSWSAPISVTHSHPSNIEVMAEGISKKYGVEKLCQHLGLEMHEVMAIGDSLNDIDLIKAAGLGVAMGNAEEPVKQAADVITKTNVQDGVAVAIQEHLLNFN